MEVRTERPSDAHLQAIPDYITCQASGGHSLWKYGDVWLMVDGGKPMGWICGHHRAEGKSEEATRVARWRHIRA